MMSYRKVSSQARLCRRLHIDEHSGGRPFWSCRSSPHRSAQSHSGRYSQRNMSSNARFFARILFARSTGRDSMLVETVSGCAILSSQWLSSQEYGVP